MAHRAYLASYPTRCFSKENYQSLISFKVKCELPTTKVNQFSINNNGNVKSVLAPSIGNGYIMKKELNQGIMFDGIKYKQTYVVRSTEVGPNNSATFESILNLIQETGLNHIATVGISDEYGATLEMSRNDLIWIVTRMQVEVDRYPTWGEKIDVETWYAPSTRNSIQRESLVRSSATGLILARSTSLWLVMNETTRRLAKIPEATMKELSPWMADKPMIEHLKNKIKKLDIDNPKYVISNLKPKISDMDSNYHVNNVKYIKWILEVVPDEILRDHKLSCMVLEFRKECGVSDVVESLCQPHADGDRDEYDNMQNILTHLLQIKGETKNEEILRATTTWKKNIFSPTSAAHYGSDKQR